MTRILLFDVDQTLLVSGGAGRRAMDRAVEDLFGVPNAFRGTRPAGKTDPAIFREMLERAAVAVEDWDQAIEGIGARYLQHLAEEVPRSPRARLMPGVVPLLESLRIAGAVMVNLVLRDESAAVAMQVQEGGIHCHHKLRGI